MDIGFAAGTAGVGRTTLCYHLTARLRHLGGDAAVIELDRQTAAGGALGLPVYSLDDLDRGLPGHAILVWNTPAAPAAEIRRLLVGCDLAVVVAGLGDGGTGEQLARQLRAAGGEARWLANGPDLPPPAPDLPVFACRVGQHTCFRRARWDGRAVCDASDPRAGSAWAQLDAVLAELLWIVDPAAELRVAS